MKILNSVLTSERLLTGVTRCGDPVSCLLEHMTRQLRLSLRARLTLSEAPDPGHCRDPGPGVAGQTPGGPGLSPPGQRGRGAGAEEKIELRTAVTACMTACIVAVTAEVGGRG